MDTSICLGFIDSFSKFVVLVPLTNANSIEVRNGIFNNWIRVFGEPQQLHSDQDKNLNSKLKYMIFAMILKYKKLEQHRFILNQMACVKDYLEQLKICCMLYIMKEILAGQML